MARTRWTIWSGAGKATQQQQAWEAEMRARPSTPHRGGGYVIRESRMQSATGRRMTSDPIPILNCSSRAGCPGPRRHRSTPGRCRPWRARKYPQAADSGSETSGLTPKRRYCCAPWRRPAVRFAKRSTPTKDAPDTIPPKRPRHSARPPNSMHRWRYHRPIPWAVYFAARSSRSGARRSLRRDRLQTAWSAACANSWRRARSTKSPPATWPLLLKPVAGRRLS